MEWKEIANAVGKAAPLLGTLLGGPAGGAVGALVASALGTGADPDAVAKELAANPEAAVKLREIEARRQTELQGMATQQAVALVAARTESLKIDAGDRDSARRRDVHASAIEAMERYDWPGNVRQLRSALRSAALLAGAARTSRAQPPRSAQPASGFPLTNVVTARAMPDARPSA